MLAAIFTILVFGGIVGVLGSCFGVHSLGTIAAIACATAFIIHAIEKSKE